VLVEADAADLIGTPKTPTQDRSPGPASSLDRLVEPVVHGILEDPGAAQYWPGGGAGGGPGGPAGAGCGCAGAPPHW